MSDNDLIDEARNLIERYQAKIAERDAEIEALTEALKAHGELEPLPQDNKPYNNVV